MKVIAFNGSPKVEGNTYHAIKMVAAELEKEEIAVEIVHVGHKIIRGCTACGTCAKEKNERCIFTDDPVNECIQKIIAADGVILGSPVYFSGIAGTMKSFLDRVFYVSNGNGGLYRYKVGAALIADRRAGDTAALHQLNNYITYGEMIVATSMYWNVIYGTVPGEVQKDDEGIQTMRVLGRNMAWALKAVANQKKQEPIPAAEAKIRTNFVR